MQSKTGFTVAVDWLTLASWSFAQYVAVAARLRREPGKWKGKKVMQYEGFSNGAIYYGKALQGEKEHYLVRVSGSISQEVIEIFNEGGPIDPGLWYATRIDIQRTIPAPSLWNAHQLYDWLRLQNMGTTSIVESETGSTVYIGARGSERFTRIYEKHYEAKYVRLEIELKGEYARYAWALIISEGCQVITELYAAHLRRLPVPDWCMVEWMPAGDADVDIREHERKYTQEKQLAWLKSLVPKFREMANSHEVGSIVRDIFYSLSLDITGELDNG